MCIRDRSSGVRSLAESVSSKIFSIRFFFLAFFLVLFRGSIRQSAEVLQLREIPLPQHFIDCHCHSIGQIQAPGFPDHGQTHTVFIIRPEQILRQTGIFPPEKEITVIRIGNVGIDLVRFGGEIVKGPIRILFKEIREAVIITDVQQVPVIQSRPLEIDVYKRQSL